MERASKNPSGKRIELPLGEPARTYTGPYHPPNCFVFPQEHYKCPILFLNHGLNRVFFFLIFFFQFCDLATHSGIMIDHPQVELAKFGYRPKEESAKR